MLVVKLVVYINCSCYEPNSDLSSLVESSFQARKVFASVLTNEDFAEVLTVSS